MTTIRQQVERIAPHAIPAYLIAFDQAEDVFPRFGLTSTLRVAHALAQWIHETGELKVLEERLSYSAARLMAVWPSRFPTLAHARLYERNPEALANFVYGGRMGNTQPGDGWRFRGRGLTQVTGRANYGRFGRLAGVDLLAEPDLASDPKHMLTIACAYWQAVGCNEFADADNLEAVTRAINGGLIGLEDRRDILTRAKLVLASDLS